ncbi:hypothetical protein KJ885_01935 [Patescibacteria group bacterium]|nr:hypothetical protein [Patescibacteria group bacterium]
MAISFEAIEASRKKSIEGSMDSERLKILEKTLDTEIVKFYIKKRALSFRKKIKIVARLYYRKNEESLEHDTLTNLINTGIIDLFIQRYLQEGWSVKYGFHLSGSPWIRFTRIIDPRKIFDQQDDVQTKRNHLRDLKTQARITQGEIQRLEGEIQMLTESPNSRDPLVLREPPVRL